MYSPINGILLNHALDIGKKDMKENMLDGQKYLSQKVRHIYFLSLKIKPPPKFIYSNTKLLFEITVPLLLWNFTGLRRNNMSSYSDYFLRSKNRINFLIFMWVSDVLVFFFKVMFCSIQQKIKQTINRYGTGLMRYFLELWSDNLHKRVPRFSFGRISKTLDCFDWGSNGPAVCEI